MNMKEYLSTAYNEFKSNNFNNITIVMGNESCDLDSAVSSLVYAAFLDWQHRGNNDHRELFLSMLDVDRNDFALKTEVTYCLKQHSVSEGSLIFREDIDFKSLINTKNLKIILVDHHILSDKYMFLSSFVTEIIDHRPVERKEWKYKEDIDQKIETVGSCTTLVCQRIKELNGSHFFDEFAVCAKLLHGVIILDTVNFSAEVNKATPLDEEVVLFLEGILKLEDVEHERKTILEDLLRARSDITSLTAAQLLKKDLKIVGNILVPSFPILVKDFLQRPQAIEAVTEALISKNCTIALLLGMDLSAGLRRDGAIVSGSAAVDTTGYNLLKFLQSWSSPPLQLTTNERIARLYFQQTNLSASRKQYMPALNAFILNNK